MSNLCVIARRLKDGHVQYGWGGYVGYFSDAGMRIWDWYQEPDVVEYLFSLGETQMIGKPGSENGGASFMQTHALTHRPFDLGTSERQIFSKIAFIEFGYFYETDQKWYYILPGPFRIKFPLEMIYNVTVGGKKMEIDFCEETQNDLLRYILFDYPKTDSIFKELLKNSGGGTAVWNSVSESRSSVHEFWEKFRELFSYFDDWVVVIADKDMKKAEGFKVRKKGEEHIETVDW